MRPRLEKWLSAGCGVCRKHTSSRRRFWFESTLGMLASPSCTSSMRLESAETAAGAAPPPCPLPSSSPPPFPPSSAPSPETAPTTEPKSPEPVGERAPMSPPTTPTPTPTPTPPRPRACGSGCCCGGVRLGCGVGIDGLAPPSGAGIPGALPAPPLPAPLAPSTPSPCWSRSNRERYWFFWSGAISGRWCCPCGPARPGGYGPNPSAVPAAPPNPAWLPSIQPPCCGPGPAPPRIACAAPVGGCCCGCGGCCC
mmetsp:Transcript_28929/g.94597  ORF Transcript_28929/g.94597 Transcript_28929/m.94597 type:complete len:253 (-) Transcript_28929:89-847(-)